MDIRTLRQFITVVQEEGISAAADVLHVSQPSLSRRMSELEHELDVTLFYRGNRARNIALTEEGEIFYRHAREIVRIDENARNEMHCRADIEGVVHIAAAQSTVMKLLGRAAALARKEYPGITFALHDGNGLDNIERLNNSTADFSVLIQPLDMSKFDHLPLPGGDRMGVLMCHDDTLAQSEVITAEQLGKLPLIVPRGTIARRELSGWYSGAKHDLNIIGTANLIYNASHFVQEGYGYALSSGNIIDVTSSSDLVFRPLEPPLYTRLSLAWRKEWNPPAAAQVFLDHLRAVVAAVDA